MRTKTQLLTLTIVGNLLIAAIFLGLSEFRTQKQQAASLAASAGLYQQAWDTMANDAFAQGIGAWHPQTGNLEKRDIWNENSTFEFPEGSDPGGAFENPLFNAIQSEDQLAVEKLVAEVFADEIDYALLSFVIALDPAGKVLHCTSSFEDFGIDPCSETDV